MPTKILRYAVFCLVLSHLASAQCIERNLLRQQLLKLMVDSTFKAEDKLQTYLQLESQTKDCPNSNDSTHEFLFRRIVESYFLLHQYQAAASYMKDAINLINRNYAKPYINTHQLVPNYYWLAIFYDSLNMPDEEYWALDSCFTIALRFHLINRASLWAVYSKIWHFFDLGDYDRSVDYAIECEKLGRECAETYAGQLHEDGLIYERRGLEWQMYLLNMLKNYEQIEKIAKNNATDVQRAGQKTDLSFLYQELAEMQCRKGNFKEASQYFNKSLILSRNPGLEYNCRSILNDIGQEIYLDHLHDPDKALSYFVKALKLTNHDLNMASIDSMETVSILDNMANAYTFKVQYDSAIIYFNQAFQEMQKGADAYSILDGSSNNFDRHPKAYLADLLLDEGDMFQDAYKHTGEKRYLDSAVKIYWISDQMLNKVKARQVSEQSKLFWRKDYKRLYEHAINACLLSNDTGKAFHFFEQSRAVLLADQLSEQHWLSAGDLRAQNDLEKKLVQCEHALQRTVPSSKKYLDLQDSLFLIRHELDALSSNIKIHNPVYYRSLLDTSYLTMDKVRRTVLADHQALIEFFNGDSAVFVFELTARQSSVEKINKRQFDSLVALYNNTISDPSMLNRHFNDFVSISSRLYSMVFSKVAIPDGRIIISPDGPNFPVESLVCGLNPSPSYFLQRHIISYTYSARYLLSEFNSDSSMPTSSFLGIAPLRFPRDFALSELPQSEQSLSQIESYFGNWDNLIGAKATKNNFMERYYKYGIIQLYTHSAENGGSNEPVIYFADSILYFSDLIPENQPSTRLVVLSACETGKGKIYEGEGIFGFNRGFAALGIPASVCNLWAVDDQSTYRITQLFYKYISQGQPSDAALQQAKLEFIATGTKTEKLPYYWAAVIVAGKTESFRTRKGTTMIYIFIGAGLCGLVYLAWVNRKTKASASPGNRARA